MSSAFLARLLQLRKAELIDYDGVRAKGVAILWSDFVDCGSTYGRIRVLPARSWSKFLENTHRPLTVVITRRRPLLSPGFGAAWFTLSSSGTLDWIQKPGLLSCISAAKFRNYLHAPSHRSEEHT